MSVMLLDDKLFATVLNNIGNFRDWPHYMPMRMDAEKTIRDLREMNVKSYSMRYEKEFLFCEFNPDMETEKINVYQLLKYMQCIEYQIEIDKPTYDEKKALKYLNGWIDTLKSGIISSMPEYSGAHWSEI